MGRTRSRWLWWKKVAAVVGVLLFLLLVVFFGCRQPWIEPLPGGRLEPTRPVVRRRDFAPDSPYMSLIRLLVAIDRDLGKRQDHQLLAVIGETPSAAEDLQPFPDMFDLPPLSDKFDFPPYPDPSECLFSPVPPDPIVEVQVWGPEGIGGKFRFHPWPSGPPPPAPPPEPVFTAEETWGSYRTSGKREEGMPGYPLLDAKTGAPIHRTPDAAIANDAPWTLEQYREVLSHLAAHEPHLPELDRILADPTARMPSPEGYYDTVPDWSPLLELCRWLAVSARVRAASGDWEGAFRDIGRVLGLTGMMTRGSPSGYWLVAYGGEREAMRAVWEIVLRDPVPIAHLRRQAREILAHADGAEPIVEAIRADAVAILAILPSVYAHARQGWMEHNALRESSGWHWRMIGAMSRFPALVGSSQERVSRNVEACMQRQVTWAEQPYSATVAGESWEFAAYIDHHHSASRVVFRVRDPLGLLLSRYWVGGGHMMFRAAARNQVNLRGMALFLALRAYELEHGGVPETLDALVPDYLPRIPEDPFDGQPFRYRPRDVPGLPPEAWAVYSVGLTFADDGGLAFRTIHRHDETSPDFVLPSQPYPPAWQERAYSRPRLAPRLPTRL